MLVVSLTTLVQQASATRDAHLGGNLSRAADLLDENKLRLLDASYNGVFAFLAFHPQADQTVVDYLHTGSLASDTGPHIMALFTLDSKAVAPKPLVPTAFGSWLTLDQTEHPAYKLIRLLFEPRPVPPLPGVAFLPQMTGEHETVYVPLQGLAEANAVREKLRSLFSLADHVFQQLGDRPREDFTDQLAVELQRSRIAFDKSNPRSLMEWVVRGYQFVGDHAGDLVSVAQLGLTVATSV